MSARFAGRRLSVPRLLLSVGGALALVAVTVGAVVAPHLTSPVPGAPLADRWFAGYYDVTLEDGEKLARSDLGLSPGGVALAFVVAAAATDCTPTWGVAYSLDDAA